MNIKSRLSYRWHLFWYCFNDRLYNDCLDQQERDKFNEKKQYHWLKALS